MATKATWKRKIKAACQEAGTYRPQFDAVIDTLAATMAIRDEAEAQYKKSGSQPVIAHTNKGGHTNLKKHPALAVIQEQNQQALAYWRDLGLTPAGFKRLDGTAVEKKEASFEEVLAKIGV